MTQEQEKEIAAITGFDVGNLPFKYLGIPTESKWLTSGQCDMLVEKISKKLKHWSAQMLSYTGKLQLINSVIFSTPNFWLHYIPLPKYVANKIESMCRTFSWNGKDLKSRRAPVAWKKVCEPKRSGGLNFYDLGRWNKVCLMKILWNLCRKNDSLWVRWVHSYYIKK